MRKLQGIFSYNLYESADELPEDLAALYSKAGEARKTAYAPYSHFHVGAAVLLENGKTVIGSNQENAAYPSGLCAERVAVFAASSQFPDVPIVAIAISAQSAGQKKFSPLSPCGDCRQVMAEYEHRQGKGIKIVMPGGDGTILLVENIGTLLPFMFTHDQLGDQTSP